MSRNPTGSTIVVATSGSISYMALMSLDPTGKGRRRWTMRWKAPPQKG
ncbi:hypothetical protein [Streptomyces gilvus]|nr:hypothetical protein [Streptomyces sp. CME 23]MCH5677508.1 hypothetical protein [Streptomyces sp. CME 23]